MKELPVALVDPFKPDPLETIFRAGAEMEAIVRKNGLILESSGRAEPTTLVEHIQTNYTLPTFWQRILILIFGVPPHEILTPRPISEAELIVASIESEPESWNHDSEYYLAHKNGMKVWIANGISSVGLYDGRIRDKMFTSNEKKMLWNAVESWKNSTRTNRFGRFDEKVYIHAKKKRISQKYDPSI